MESDNIITKEMLKEIANKKGMTNKGHIEKDYFQDLFLYHIYKRTNLLVFKGGTCLYKIYSLPRFSEDLDFSVLGKIDAEKLITDIADKTASEIKSIKRMKNSLLIKITYDGIFTSYSNSLRIDINLENPVFRYDIMHYVPSYIDINPFSLRVLSLPEILAEKIHTIYARQKARDLYDLFFLLRFVEPDRTVIDRKLGIFGMQFDFATFEGRVNDLKDVWVPEMRPFVLTDLPAFEPAKEFVLEKLSKISGHKT